MHHIKYSYFSIMMIIGNNEPLQVSLVWRSILDTVDKKTKLTLGKKCQERDDQVLTLNELIPNLDLGKSSTLSQNCRFCSKSGSGRLRLEHHSDIHQRVSSH
jgi:hypothetical protein